MESEESSPPDSGSGQCGSDDIPPHPERNAVPGRHDECNASDSGAQGGEAERARESNEHRVPRDVEDGEEPNFTDARPRPVPELEERGTDEGLKVEAVHPYAEIGPPRDSETDKLLAEWRARHREHKQKERLELHAVNPHGAADSLGITGPDQAASNETNTEAMNLEEPIGAAIQVRVSEAWSKADEVKRHSQAPHLKWAKNVVSEIFGVSESQANTELHQGSQGRGPEKGQGDSTEGGEENSVHAVLQRTRIQDGELAAEQGPQPLQPEDVRDDEETRSDSWGDVELRNVLDTIQRKRKNSRFFNKAQLYQQYNEAAQNIEILRQSRSDFLSTSDDLPVSLIVPSPVSSPSPSPPPARRPLPPLPPLPSTPQHHFLFPLGTFSSSVSAKTLPLPEPPKTERRASSPRLSASLGQSSTLWQELPGVRNSTELGELAEDQRRLQEVRFEVLTSEASYCRSLDIVVEHFVKSKQLGALLTAQDRNWLFSRLADVRAISHSFLSKLEERIDSDTIHFTVCDIIARYCPHFKMVYVPYLTNQSYQDATYQRLMSENPGFKRVVEKLERSTVCQRLPLRSFLILPFQRITRLKLLVQNILKRTAPSTEDETQAIKALKLLEKLIIESNDSITQMKSIESLVSLSAKVDFECRTLPLVSQSRRLVREGPVTEMMDFSMKESERNVYLHLFNDYLLLSLHKEGGRFIVIDHAPVSELRAENCRVKLLSLQKNLFRLYLSNKALLLRTDSQSDKLRWITAVSRPHAEIDYSAAQDLTQMQCIRAIIAQQPDEISLEKAEVILVHQQSSDGWVEGTRLSDRQRGWAPVSHLEAITSSRVRQRNLTDALKITTAAAAV